MPAIQLQKRLYTGPDFGAWRSLVARTVRVGEVPSSNLGAPILSESPARPAGLFEFSGRALSRHRGVVAHRQAGDQRLERAFHGDVLPVRPALEAVALDRLALLDDVIDELGVAVAEERADGVQARVGERLEERAVVVGGLRHTVSGRS